MNRQSLHHRQKAPAVPLPFTREALASKGDKIMNPWKHNKDLTLVARDLRKNMTKQEKHLWYDFLKNYEVRVLRQKVIDRITK